MYETVRRQCYGCQRGADRGLLISICFYRLTRPLVRDSGEDAGIGNKQWFSPEKGLMPRNNLFSDEAADRNVYSTPRMIRSEHTVRWYLNVNPNTRRRACLRSRGNRLAQRFAETLWNTPSMSVVTRMNVKRNKE